MRNLYGAKYRRFHNLALNRHKNQAGRNTYPPLPLPPAYVDLPVGYDICVRLPSALVEKVEIDVGEMKPGDFVEVSDLAIASNPDLEVSTSKGAVLVLVAESHTTALAEDESADEEE